MMRVKNHQAVAMVLVETALGRKSQPCWTQLAIENQRQWCRLRNGVSPSPESSSAVSKGENLEMMKMETETATPPANMSSQTPVESGARKEKKSIDFSGEATYRMEMPRSRKGMEKSTTCSRSKLMLDKKRD